MSVQESSRPSFGGFDGVEDNFFEESLGDSFDPGRSRRVALVAGLALVALGLLISLIWSGALPPSRGFFSALFSGDDVELVSPGGGAAEESGSPSEQGNGEISSHEASPASLASRRNLLVDELAPGPSGEVASFVDSRREVRQVRGGAAPTERVLSTRPRDREAVQARVRAVGPAIQRCYERRMLTRGRLGGTIEVGFVVSASGAISNVRARSATLRDRDLMLCLRSRLSGVNLGRGPVERYAIPLRLIPSE